MSRMEEIAKEYDELHQGYFGEEAGKEARHLQLCLFLDRIVVALGEIAQAINEVPS